MTDKKEFKERMYYLVETDDKGNTWYTGQLVNIPVCCSAENLEELSKRLKTMATVWIEFMAEHLPFEFEVVKLDSSQEFLSK